MWLQPIGEPRLLLRVQHEILAQQVAFTVRKAVVEAGGDIIPAGLIVGAAGGDRARMRGIPVFVEGGIGGAIYGTRPGQFL